VRDFLDVEALEGSSGDEDQESENDCKLGHPACSKHTRRLMR